MKRALLGATVVIAMMVSAAPALAADPGFLEICKSSTGLSGTPSFTYTVSNGGGTVVVPNNSCSRPFPVTAGNVTVTEAPGTFYTVSSITSSPGSALISSNPKGTGALNAGPNGRAVVSVPSSADQSGTVILNYTNVPVTGYIEVCKNNASDSGLTGSFGFTIRGNNAFTTTVSVPVGKCSFPILVPAGAVTVTEDAPNSVTDIGVQNGAPSTTNTGGGTATVTVKPSPAPGDTSQEAIVSFANRTVQLKVCKLASDPGVTAPYAFTAVGSGDPSFPGGITRTVTVLPGQCQLLPGPYTNPNGTTGWRAGTRVAVSEGVVPGTAVTSIAVVPASREVPGTRTVSPLPNPTTPGPAGSDAVLLGSGETQVTFTNDTVPNGTLKICENVDPKAPAGTSFTFNVSSPAPAGSTTSATVPMGSCTIVPNPVTTDGMWLYNSTVTIAQVSSGFAVVPPIAVSPTARMLSQTGGTVNVSIGSADTTIATYTNDPPSGSTSGATGGGSNSGGSNGNVIGSVGGSPIGTPPTSGGGSKSAPKPFTLLRSARLIKSHGRHFLVVRVASSNKKAKIRIVMLNKRGKQIRSFTRIVATNHPVTLAIPFPRGVKVVSARLA